MIGRWARYWAGLLLLDRLSEDGTEVSRRGRSARSSGRGASRGTDQAVASQLQAFARQRLLPSVSRADS